MIKGETDTHWICECGEKLLKLTWSAHGADNHSCSKRDFCKHYWIKEVLICNDCHSILVEETKNKTYRIKSGFKYEAF